MHEAWNRMAHSSGRTQRRAGFALGLLHVAFCLQQLLGAPALAAEDPWQRYWDDARRSTAVEKSAAARQRLQWWREARLGALVTLDRAGDAAGFDAAAICRALQAAGIKYALVAANGPCGLQVDGAAPAADDRIGRLAAAARGAGLKVGLFYSQHAAHPADLPQFYQRRLTDLRPLLAAYGAWDVFATDGLRQKPEPAETERFLRLVFQLQPAAVVNHRVGVPADYDGPLQLTGGYNARRGWEATLELAEGPPAAGGALPTDKILSADTPEGLLQQIVTTAGGDGNALLHLRLAADGRIDPQQQQRLDFIGRWMSKYGPAFYATGGGPYRPGKWGVSTRRDNKIYLHIFDWSKFPPRLPILTKPLTGLQVLTGGSAEVKQYNDSVALLMATDQRDVLDTIVCLEIDGQVSELPPVTLAVKKGK